MRVFIIYGKPDSGHRISIFRYSTAIRMDGTDFRTLEGFPVSLPPLGEKAPWLVIDVDFADAMPSFTVAKKWPAYMQAILDYVRAGQDPQLSDAEGFRIQVDGKARWFHSRGWLRTTHQVANSFTE
jgi:hypothetical protein